MKLSTRVIKHNTHPGEIILNQILKPNKLTVEKTAELLKVTRATISKIVNGKSAISPLMAIRISKVFGGSASFWIRIQTTYDLRKAEKEFKDKQIKLDRFKYI
ncbi:HigA family addiction module antitoxin [Elizabethkingia anophelis]|uniref:HigA family addiction module antitoxin n=1 Tax=Elizabethkingia anophelis TaxID=1117645 RepID=UPI00137179C3|nr:HigA family addiction module antitoxin [Elizabethkingia anophelis]MYY29518.1 addiction module antidote protein, HigA family [Elizabethkingia anophelis]HAY3506926.1 HigA family addiction module antidote protein [Elizabethkingia anophelis]